MVVASDISHYLRHHTPPLHAQDPMISRRQFISDARGGKDNPLNNKALPRAGGL